MSLDTYSQSATDDNLMNHEAWHAKNSDFSFVIGGELSTFFKAKDTTKPMIMKVCFLGLCLVPIMNQTQGPVRNREIILNMATERL